MEKEPLKTFYVQYSHPLKTFIEKQTANFAMLLTCSALEGFPIINGVTLCEGPNHLALEFTLPESYEKELEQTLVGTGFYIK